MAFCPECGSALSVGAKFCANCGQRIDLLDKTHSTSISQSSFSRTGMVRLGSDLDPSIRASMSQTLFVVAQSLLSDFQRLLNRWHVNPMAMASGADVTSLRARTQEELKRHKGRLRYVCILGDWKAIPPYEIHNPHFDAKRPNKDRDLFCFSDAPYAGAEEKPLQCHPEDLIPNLSLGRIPVMDINVIERCLTQQFSNLTPSEALLFSVTTQSWEEATEEIIRQGFPGKSLSIFEPDEDWGHEVTPFIVSPEWNEDYLRNLIYENPIKEGCLMHFNVHGTNTSPIWVGEGAYLMSSDPIIFSPETVADYRSSFLLSEACYGANMNFDDERSIVEEFFIRGGHGFVGCSVVAYGSDDANISFADIIAAQFFKSLRHGMSFGASLSAAKMVAMASGPSSGYLLNLKTICSFNLFGAPWHNMRAERKTQSEFTSSATTEGRAIDRIRNRISASNSGETDSDDDSLLSLIRQQYRERIKIPVSWQSIRPDQSSTQLAQVLDDPEISTLLQQYGFSTGDVVLDHFQFSDDEGYLLQTNRIASTERNLILALNADGRLQQVIISKERVKS